ncbi:hypothetical protein A9Q91_06135 [Candidatus Gracilibacteria bacterium 28_42_T64]|nr:hypothetical protein A9Q91_06135 [Candidatus Gracilibacteria bacterium 28_42_T64]
MKRYFEIFIIIGVLSYILYLIMYTFFFTNFCNGYGGIGDEEARQTLVKMADCKDSLVCEIGNTELNVRENTVKSWSCNRKKVNYFEAEYYLNYYNNL